MTKGSEDRVAKARRRHRNRKEVREARAETAHHETSWVRSKLSTLMAEIAKDDGHISMMGTEDAPLLYMESVHAFDEPYDPDKGVHVPAALARSNWSDLLALALYVGEEVVLTRNGTAMVVIYRNPDVPGPFEKFGYTPLEPADGMEERLMQAMKDGFDRFNERLDEVIEENIAPLKRAYVNTFRASQGMQPLMN